MYRVSFAIWPMSMCDTHMRRMQSVAQYRTRHAPAALLRLSFPSPGSTKASMNTGMASLMSDQHVPYAS